MKPTVNARIGCIALVMAASLASLAQGQPTKWEPASCALWNSNTARSQMRLTFAVWVRAYLEQQRGVSFPRGYADRDLRRFLDQHCKANPADDIQKAADALGQSFLSGANGNDR